MPTVEDIMRQQKIRRIIFRVVLLIIISIICVLIGWFIGTIGQKDSNPLSEYHNPVRSIVQRG